MPRNFYYGSDARVVAGSANFAAVLVASAGSLGVSPEQAAHYQSLDAILQDAYRAATTPETRTSMAVRAKDDAMRACQRQAAGLATRLAYTPTVSDAQLVQLGLQPRRPRRRITAAPASVPTVEVVRVAGRVVTLRIHARTAEGTRLAAGTIGAIVWSHVGDQPPADPQQYQMEGYASRGTYTIVFPNEVPSGATAFVSAGWISRRGRRGACCPPVRFTIQGGPALAADGSA